MILAVEAPQGPVLEFGLLFGVILLGPVIVRRARIPGIIGLLLGGFLIGPHGLGLIGAGNQTVPELGQLGLLYLMFVAGLELDLRLLSAYRRAAVTFALMTFTLPFVGGLGVGLAQGWSVAASLLLGSLLASHTLILYPTIREAGRAANPAVATAVGATVLTDTLALVVLAGVAGTSTGEGSTAVVLGQVAVGLVVLVGVGLLVLPRVARAALRLWGGDRAARYLVAVVAFLLMAMLAEVFSIEGIVGAFFAGIALNRLVPNDGPSMERIEFFGTAVFVPVFLVSVGLLLDPSVMFSADTLAIAALLVVASVGGKAVASWLSRPLLGFSSDQAGVMFVLTTPQAAATLAATIVGFEIGLFGTAVVNAILVLILVSILVSTLLADRYTRRIEAAASSETALGDRVLLATRSDGPSPAAIELACALAQRDSGLVELIVAHREEEEPLSAMDVFALERRVFSGAIEGTARSVVDRSLADAVVHAALPAVPSVVVLDAGPDQAGGWEPLARHLATTPAVILIGTTATVPEHLVVVGAGDRSGSPAEAIADALERQDDPAAIDGDWPTDASIVARVPGWDSLDDLHPPAGSLVLAVVAPDTESRTD